MEPMLLSIRQPSYHLYTGMFEKILNENSLTQLEVEILLFLADNKKTDTAAEIVSAKHLSKSHVSSSVENLVFKGYIERHMDKVNKKNIHLKLTDKAKPIVKTGRKVRDDFSSVILKNFSEDEIKLLNSLLSRISDNIYQARHSGD